jgi:hypothetical protein
VNSTNGLGINDRGQIVGIYGKSTTDGQEFSFLATPSHIAKDLTEDDQ